MKTLHKTFKIIRLLFVLIAPFGFVFMTLADSKSCSQFVIDTYEIHAKIDIPKVQSMNCYYDEEAALRISVLDLKKDVSLARFKLVDHAVAVRAISGINFLSEVEQPTAQTLSLATGEKWGRKWVYIYDSAARRLWAELRY